MDTPSPADVDRILDGLAMAVQHVGHLNRARLDAYAVELPARRRLFERLAQVIVPILPVIAERHVVADDVTTYYLQVDERKRRIWYLAHNGETPPFLASATSPTDPPAAVLLNDAVRTIRFDELVRRTAIRLRGSIQGLAGRAEEAERMARTMDAVAALLEA